MLKVNDTVRLVHVENHMVDFPDENGNVEHWKIYNKGIIVKVIDEGYDVKYLVKAEGHDNCYLFHEADLIVLVAADTLEKIENARKDENKVVFDLPDSMGEYVVIYNRKNHKYNVIDMFTGKDKNMTIKAIAEKTSHSYEDMKEKLHRYMKEYADFKTDAEIYAYNEAFGNEMKMNKKYIAETEKKEEGKENKVTNESPANTASTANNSFNKITADVQRESFEKEKDLLLALNREYENSPDNANYYNYRTQLFGMMRGVFDVIYDVFYDEFKDEVEELHVQVFDLPFAYYDREDWLK